MNPLDMPPPELPGQNPMRYTEIVEQVARHFVATLGVDPIEADRRAVEAVERLMSGGYLLPHSLGEDNEFLYSPSTPVFVYVRRR